MSSLSYKATRSPYLSVVIPAYNEEKRIVNTLLRIKEYLERQPYTSEIIVVDDGSVDKTVDTVNRLLGKIPNLKIILNGINRGKGYSVKNGFLNAQGTFLLLSDADLSTPIEEIRKLMEFIDSGYDIAIGSRGLRESNIEIRQVWYRGMMGQIFNLIVRGLTVRGFKDTQCGFKCFKSEAALEICKRQKMDRFSFDVEMLYIARRLGYGIKEVPIRWLNSPHSKVDAVRESFQMFIDLIKIRINDLKGLYS
jgi:dolichyl-phosphate beta-glucosyltransferase